MLFVRDDRAQPLHEHGGGVVAATGVGVGGKDGVPLGLCLGLALPGLRQQCARVAQSAPSCWSLGFSKGWLSDGDTVALGHSL